MECRLVKDTALDSHSYVLHNTNNNQHTRWSYELDTIYEIDDCGVNHEKKVFEWNGDTGFYMMFLNERKSKETGAFHGRVDKRLILMKDDNYGANFCFPGSKICILANAQGTDPERNNDNDANGSDREAIIILSICQCAGCMTPASFFVGDIRGMVGDKRGHAEVHQDQVPDEEENTSSNDNSSDEFSEEDEDGSGWSEYSPVIDTAEIKPVSVKLELECGKEKICLVYDFKPGCTKSYDLSNDMCPTNRPHVVYYATIKLKDLEPFPWEEYERIFADSSAGGIRRVPLENGYFTANGKCIRLEYGNGDHNSISICEIKDVSKKIADEHSLLNQIREDNDEVADFLVVSPDPNGKEFPVHKSMLAARSHVFVGMFAQEHIRGINEGKLFIPRNFSVGNAVVVTNETVEAFVMAIYYKQSKLISSDGEVAAGLLLLAHQYDLMDVVASTSKVIIRKLKAGKWTNGPVLQDLLCFARLEGSNQIITRLKKTIDVLLKKVEKL
ncbi:unnamed protein product [Orchesella dallaii]|uniref:BTB domain-containing protein n=1 Tax=Orchesella dallaii TaxID=48710 RepID=A0ABP1Q1S9_9HEXA